MSLQSAKIKQFSGGLNSEAHVADLQPTEWDKNTVNIELAGGDQSSIRGRRGVVRVPLTGTALPSPSSTTQLWSVESYRLAGAQSDRLIAASDDGAIYTIDLTANPSTVANPLAAAGGSGKTWKFVQNADSAAVQYVWCLNGVGTPQKVLASTGVASAWAGSPPNGTVLKSWKNMMIISGVSSQPQRLYFSAINNPESWPANNFIDIKSTDDEQDTIVALQVIGENLLVFKQKSVWLVFDPVSFENRRITDVGCINGFATTRYLDKVYWIGPGGVYSTDGQDVAEESKNIRSIATLYSNSANTIPSIRMAALGEGLVGWMLGFGVTSQNALYYMDLNKTRPDGQHPWFYFSGNPIWDMLGFTEVLTLGRPPRWVTIASNATGGGGAQRLYYLFASETADDMDGNGAEDQDVGGVYWSPPISIEEAEKFERLRRLNLIASGNAGQSFNLIDVTVAANLYLNIEDFTGSIEPTDPTLYKLRPETRGRYHRVKLDIGRADIVVSEIEFMFRGGKEH